MANRHKKRYSTLLIIREMQIKTTMRNYFTPVRMTIIKTNANNKCWQECGGKRAFIHCCWERNRCSHCGSKMDVSQKTKNKAIVWSAIPPWVCPQNHKTLIQKDTHTPNVQCSIIFNCQDVETTCPSTDEWIKKIWCIYTQWNTTQPWKRMKFCLLPQEGWIWRVLC